MDNTEPMKTRHLERWAALGPVAVAAVLIGYQLSQPNVLTGIEAYDDGVYMGASLLMWRGSLPYADFVFVHPPGILLLMGPVSVASHVIGEANAFVVARLLTAAAAVANAGLVALVVRRHGPLAMVGAGLTLATFPYAVGATHTLTLEPWLALFATAGAVVLFDGNGNVASRRRQVVAGVLMGVAVLIKLWGAMVVVTAVTTAFATVGFASARRVAVAAGATFTIPLLLFMIPGGGSVLANIVGAQAGRKTEGIWSLSIAQRLAALTGYSLPLNPAPSWLPAVITIAVAVVAVVWFRHRAQLRAVDLFVLSTAILAVVTVLAGPQFYPQYPYFPVAMMAMVVGSTLGLATSGALARAGFTDASRQSSSPDIPTPDSPDAPPPVNDTGLRARQGARPSVGALAIVAAALTMMAIGAVANAATARDRSASFLGGAKPRPDFVREAIPAGSCVAADNYAALIVTGRFIDGQAGCDIEVDPFGLILKLNNGRGSTANVTDDDEFTRQWRQRMADADRIFMSVERSSFLPWPPGQRAWFDANFTLVGTEGNMRVYAPRP